MKSTPNPLPPHTAHKFGPHFTLLLGRHRSHFVQLSYTHHGFLVDHPRLVGEMRQVFDMLWVAPRFKACRRAASDLLDVADMKAVRYIESATKGCGIIILTAGGVDYLALGIGDAKQLVLEASLGGQLEQAIDYIRELAPHLAVD